MGKRKAPDQDPGLFILKTLTVPGIGQLSNFLLVDLLDFTA